MKKLFALLLTVVVVLSVTAACGSEKPTDSSAPAAQSNTPDAAPEDAAENNPAAGSFSFQGLTFSIPGDFEEKATREDAAVYSNGTFSITLNYDGETSDTNQEESVKADARSTQKYHPESTVEVHQNETTGIFYYTIKGTDYDHAACEYIIDGISVSFVTSNFSEEALNTISSVEFVK